MGLTCGVLVMNGWVGSWCRCCWSQHSSEGVVDNEQVADDGFNAEEVLVAVEWVVDGEQVAEEDLRPSKVCQSVFLAFVTLHCKLML